MLTQAEAPAALKRLKERVRKAADELDRTNGRTGQNVISFPEGTRRFGLYSEDRAEIEDPHGHAHAAD